MAVEEGSPLNIVLDTNVIVAALIRRGIVRDLALVRSGVFITLVVKRISSGCMRPLSAVELLRFELPVS